MAKWRIITAINCIGQTGYVVQRKGWFFWRATFGGYVFRNIGSASSALNYLKCNDFGAVVLER